MKKLALLTISLLLFCVGVEAQDSTVMRIIEIAKTDNQAMKHLDVLCNKIGGRFIGSDALITAEEWAIATFKKWGLKVIVEEVGDVPVGFNRGPWFGRMLSDDGMILHFATPSYTAGTKGVQRGHVVIAPKDTVSFKRMVGTLNGAWVLIPGKSEGWPIDTTFMRKEMVEAGALGFIQSASSPIRVLYDRKHHREYTFDSLPELPEIKLDEDQYAIIEKKVKEREYFQLEFDIRNHFKPGPVKYRNIIGVLEGSEFPEEYVIMSGHLDAYDVATGGVDCGSGSAVTLEAARLLATAGARPKRTILFCLWTGEEAGLLGSKYWVEQHPEALPKISNMMNRDGGPTVCTGISVPKAMYDDFVSICKGIDQINHDFPFTVRINTRIRPKPTTAGGSDYAYFAMAGVPTITTDLTDPKGYNFDYREIWHTERDLYNKSIPEYQEHSSVVTAIILYGIANLDHLLSREGCYLSASSPDPSRNAQKPLPRRD